MTTISSESEPMPSKPVYVEKKEGQIVRIYRDKGRAKRSGADLETKQDAVYAIRKAVFDRANGKCERCGNPIWWSTGHLHEGKPKGRGGEVSIANCLALCPECHLSKTGVHADHHPAWSQTTGGK